MGILSALLGKDGDSEQPMTPLVHAPLLAIDLELTGLDKGAKILSMGWVEASGGSIKLETAYHQIFQTEQSLEQSPVIHGIVDEHVRDGDCISTGLKALAQLGSDLVWVFHNAELDVAALKRGFSEQGLEVPKVNTLDTMRLAIYLKQKQQQHIEAGSVTLSACREHYGLMPAPAHNALDDAMATIELLFCQLADLDPKAGLTLKQLKHTGAVAST